MKESGFVTALAKYFIFISCAVWASNTFAYLKINYQSDEIPWYSEEYQLVGDDWSSSASFFASETIGFNVDFIIPEFALPDSGSVLLSFDDVIVDLTTTNLLISPRVTKSRFELELFGPEFGSISSWGLSFDVIDQQKPENGTAQGGSFWAGGGIEWNPDGSGNGSGIGDANFQYYLDNWTYKTHSTDPFGWELNSDVFFGYAESKLTVEKVSVPEPFLPALLLIGLSALVVNRRRSRHNNLN